MVKLKLEESNKQSENGSFSNEAMTSSKSSEDSVDSSLISSANGNSADIETVKKTTLVNGSSNITKTLNTSLTMNGKGPNHSEMKNLPINGYSFKETSDTRAVNGNSSKKSAHNTQIPNGNCNSSVEAPLVNGHSKSNNCLNGIDISLENDCSSGSEQNGEHANENEGGFTTVINRKKQNHLQKKFSSIHPSRLNGANMKRDRGNDKKCGKTSPTQIPPKNCVVTETIETLKPQVPSNSSLSSFRSTGKSYSSAVLHGNAKHSQLHSSSKISTNNDKKTSCVKPFPSDLLDTTEKIKTLDNQRLASNKAEINNVLPQSDTSFKEMQNECLKASEELNHQLEEAQSSIGFVAQVNDSAVTSVTDVTLNNNEVELISTASYCENENSNNFEPSGHFYEFPRERVGSLIGQRGSYRHEIRRRTGVDIWVLQNDSDDDKSVVQFNGTESQIEAAINMIETRFRNVSLQRVHIEPMGYHPTLPEYFVSIFPIGIPFLAFMSCAYTPNCFWAQKLGDPHYHVLEEMETVMTTHYTKNYSGPEAINPSLGNVVAFPADVGDQRRWLRGEIVELFPEQGTVTVRQLDYGGERGVLVNDIRPLIPFCMATPVFAGKCNLYGVAPNPAHCFVEGIGAQWSQEAVIEFQRLCSYRTNMKVLMRVDGEYFVSILGFDPELKAFVDVAEMLVMKGYAVYEYSVYGSVPFDANPAVPFDANPAVPLDANPAVPLDANPAVPLDANPAVPLDANPAVPLDANPAED